MRVARHLLCGGALALSACEDRDPMQVQERDNAFSEDPLFADERAMRPTVAGTVPQEWYRQQARFMVHQSLDAGWVARPPVPLTRELLHEGRSHFETWCAPCHGLLADGQSVVGQNMQLRPAPALFGPLHVPHPARSASQLDGGVPEPGSPHAVPVSAGWEALPHPAGFYYAVITEGYGLMPSYAEALKPSERWAVAAYLRALAYSQQAPMSAAPPAVQATLQQERSGGVP
ncbi:c-type cytochrome [Hyalangium minutum]|nr:cytochrome c [Hyalangium minutum]